MSELSRLRWLCRRGMKELDVVMSQYLDQYYEAADESSKLCFKRLLEMPDPDLYGLLLGRKQTDDEELEHLLQILRGMSAQRH